MKKQINEKIRDSINRELKEKGLKDYEVEINKDHVSYLLGTAPLTIIHKNKVE